MKLIKVNKHVMADDHGTEYYRNSKGAWRPGSYDGKKFVWQSTTKYTYERFLKPAYAPIGKNGKQYKRAYLECFRALYWDGMELYKAVDVQLEDGRWINTIEPFYDYDQMWDRWPEVERDITTETLEDTTTPEHVEDTDIVEAANEIVEAEAARVAWIEGTTTEGQQIDMFAYFGYGNNEWQELAYAGR